jgi:hypothetical protein
MGQKPLQAEGGVSMKMAREGRLRRLHRRDWPGYLSHIVPASVWQTLASDVPKSKDRRIRWSPKFVVLCWVAIGWSIQRQLTERFREARELLAALFYRKRRPGGTYQGLVKATYRWGMFTLHRFWECLRPTLAPRLGTIWYWHNWIVLTVDGSRFDAPRTRPNERALGKAGRDKTHPQWWVTWMTHLPTNMIWDWRVGPGDSSERSHLREMISALPELALVVADIGFGGYDLLNTLDQAGVNFLIRCGGNTNLLVEATRQRIEKEGEHRYVYLWPEAHRDRPPLKLRLIVLKRKGQRVYLLTNVLESQRLSRRMAGEFYDARWGVEVSYRGLKQTLERRKMLATTPGPGALELAGNILAMALLMVQGALALGACAARLSVAAALRVIRWAIEVMRYTGGCSKFLDRLLGAVKDEYVRRRSKAAREWPHKKKELRPSPPKMRRPSASERACIHMVNNSQVMVSG